MNRESDNPGGRCGTCNRPFSAELKPSRYYLGVEDWQHPLNPGEVVERVICTECAEDRDLDQVVADIQNDIPPQ